MWRYLLLLLLLACPWLPLHAEPYPLPADPAVSLNRQVQFLQDVSGQMSIDAVRQSGQPWQPNDDSAFNQGYSTSVWWLKLALHNADTQPVERYLELSYAVLDHLDIHVYDGDKRIHSWTLGDLYPFGQRPVESRYFVIPLHWTAGQTLQIYYRIKTDTAVQAPLTLWERSAFEKEQGRSNIIYGLYFGAMVVIAVYNLLIFFVLWERSYLFYVLFVLAIPLFVASISGHAYHYLWPDWVLWNDHAIPVFLGLSFGASALFSRRFLRVKFWSVWVNRILASVALASFGCVALSFAVPYYISIHLLVPLGLFACLFEVLVGVLAWRKQVPNARYYLMAWMTLLLGGALLALNKMNVLPTNFLTEYAVQFGSVLEAVLLSFALAERINVERKLRYEAQSESLQATRRLNEELEQRVLERTRALEIANARLEELSNTDQLTGLRNRRYLENVLQEEWQRCKRYGNELAVLIMDVDFFKQVNDRYGHAAGDACLKQVARQLGQCVRWPSDQLARYGGEEFCMVMPETDGASARVVAERIREQVQSTIMLADNLQFSVTISVGICAGVPTDSLAMSDMLRKADRALYQSKQAGRNRVTLEGEENRPAVSPRQGRPESGANQR